MWIDPSGTGRLPSSGPLLPTLRRGMGLKPQAPVPAVKALQVRLGVLPADGRFGNITTTAVKRFQRQQVDSGRPGWAEKDIDGIVGQQTWAALNAVMS